MRRRAARATVSILSATLALATNANAERTLEEYRYFRALSIDLQGRIPTRAEITDFERPEFSLEGWIDAHLTGSTYAERVRRVYADALRLELSTAFNFQPAAMLLRRTQVMDPSGRLTWVYYRQGQRRGGTRAATTDRNFCMTAAETGITIPRVGTPDLTTARRVDAAVWNAATVAVRPWWLYRDYRAAAPATRTATLTGTTWTPAVEGFVPIPALLTEPDGTTPAAAVRVCREEGQTAATGAMGTNTVACDTNAAFANAPECGCGVGLERCLPGTNTANMSAAFSTPSRLPLGEDAPFDAVNQTPENLLRIYWGQEATHFLDYVFAQDRPVSELLTARYSFVNGPLTQFYRSIADYNQSTAGFGAPFNYVTPVPLFNPAALPAALLPHDVGTWQQVADRGPQASGLLTMPIFLTKYGTRRARAHVLYNAFMCRDFVAANVMLRPSTNPNLMTRDGCATCHARLEPMAAYFTRVSESGWTYLPRANFPAESASCNAANANAANCRTYYDPDFATAARGLMRGAYGSETNAEAGPAGLARAITTAPEFNSCVTENVLGSFLGRPLSSDDDALRDTLTQTLATGGGRMRALVRAIVLSDAYRHANNLSPMAWRERSGR